MRRVVFLFFCLIVVLSCSDNQKQAFISNEDLRLQIGKAVHFSYDPLHCQLSFSRSRKEFRCQTDNTSDYYCAVFDKVPANLGEKVKAKIEWTTSIDILSRSNVIFEVVKIEDDTFWLWSNTDNIGINIRILE